MKSIFSSKHAAVGKAKIASVGMPDEQADIFKKSLPHYEKKLNSKWSYTGNYDVNETINTMGSNIDAEYLLIDIDRELGKRVWYFLSAIRDGNKTIAFTQEPWNTDAQLVINKPLPDYTKGDQSIEANKIITLLNKIDTNTIPVSKSQSKWSW